VQGIVQMLYYLFVIIIFSWIKNPRMAEVVGFWGLGGQSVRRQCLYARIPAFSCREILFIVNPVILWESRRT
jgi:hypothetical protein